MPDVEFDDDTDDSDDDATTSAHHRDTKLRTAYLRERYQAPGTGGFYANTGQIHRPRTKPKRITTYDMIQDRYAVAKDALRDHAHHEEILQITYKPDTSSSISKIKQTLPIINSNRKLFTQLLHLWSVMEQSGMTHFMAYIVLRDGQQLADFTKFRPPLTEDLTATFRQLIEVNSKLR